MQRTYRPHSRKPRAGLWTGQILTALAAVIFLVPLYIILNYSFKTKRELYLSSPLALASSFNWSNYETAFQKLRLDVTMFNSLLYTAVSVLLLALICGAAAWAIARGKKRIFKISYIYFLVGILIPAQALFLPIFIVGVNTGLYDTRIGIIFIHIASNLSFGIFLMNSFMTTIPLEIEESARIDGCSIYRVFFKIVLPLLKPAMATLIILQAFGIWNDYLMSSIYLSDRGLIPVTVGLRSLFSTQASDYTTAFAAIVLSAVPIIILFVSLQKYFIKGMTVGAVKG